jgi:hypothetical protein
MQSRAGRRAGRSGQQAATSLANSLANTSARKGGMQQSVAGSSEGRAWVEQRCCATNNVSCVCSARLRERGTGKCWEGEAGLQVAATAGGQAMPESQPDRTRSMMRRLLHGRCFFRGVLGLQSNAKQSKAGGLAGGRAGALAALDVRSC